MRSKVLKNGLRSYFVLLAFAIIMGSFFVYSSLFAMEYSTDSFEVDKKFFNHMLGLGIGFALGFIAFIFSDKLMRSRKAMWGLYIVMCAFLVAVLFAKPIGGVHRWIVIAGLQLQPSEIAKFALPAFLAFYYESYTKEKKNIFNSIFIPIILIAIPIALVFIEPNLSTSIIISSVAFAACFFGIKNNKMAFSLIIIAVVIFISLFCVKDYILKPYQKERATKNDNYQTLQSVKAIKNGGLIGKSPFGGDFKYYVPESYSDFMMAIIGEEWGKLGIIVVLTLFFFLSRELARLGYLTRDPATFTYCAAISFWLMTQVAINTLVGLGSDVVPVTGVTLPLMSYGNTSMMFTMTGLGFGLGLVYKQINTLEEKEEVTQQVQEQQFGKPVVEEDEEDDDSDEE